MRQAVRPLDSWDVLKIVAMLIMFVDHAGEFIFNDPEQAYWLRAIGRGAAPIFLFLTGYARSYRFNRELFWLAVLYTAFDWIYFWHVATLNILATILIIRAIFDWFERRGRVIQRPWEWYIGCIALIVTVSLTQYGSLGFLLGLCGYMRRHEVHYSRRLRHVFAAATVCFYAAFVGYFAEPPMNPYVAFVMVAGVMSWCMCFEVRPMRGFWARAGVQRLLRPLSFYSGYIYVFHLIALMLITGIAG